MKTLNLDGIIISINIIEIADHRDIAPGLGGIQVDIFLEINNKVYGLVFQNNNDEELFLNSAATSDDAPAICEALGEEWEEESASPLEHGGKRFKKLHYILLGMAQECFEKFLAEEE